MKTVYDKLGIGRMTLTTKFTGGILVLTLLMLAASIAGLYGVSRVETLLSFITGPIWNSASGSYHIRIAAQDQMRYMRDYLSGRLDVEAARDSMRDLDEAMEQQTENIAESRLVPEENIAKLREGRADYSIARADLTAKHGEFVRADAAFRAGFDDISTFARKGIASDDTREQVLLKMRIALLDSIRLYERLVAEPGRINERSARLWAQVDAVEHDLALLASSATYRATISSGQFAGGSYTQALGKVLVDQEGQLRSAVDAFLAMNAARQHYQEAAVSLLKTVQQVQEIVENAMVAQRPAVVAARTAAYAVVILTLIIGLGMALFLAWYLSKIIMAAFRRVVDVSEGMRRGDLHTIEVETTGDEVQDMMVAMKGMVDALEARNERINNSVIQLMGSVLQLSRKDLTTKATVTEDVTGPVADALNLMTSETARVLGSIRSVSLDVEQAAKGVQLQSGQVMDVAQRERLIVATTAKGLHASSAAMTHLAEEAGTANETARVAMKHTRGALEAVGNTIGSIEQIRDVIREAEKRIKRLGERSQEVTSAVNLINTISERTHILALNASMHAASAGEAGRGFAVVADEVQRLAESSREATSDISSMVNNIRVETADTVNTMNQVISQVAEGTHLAADAGKRMQETEETTAQLVAAVEGIAEHATKQATVATELEKRAHVIVQSTKHTGEELTKQAGQMESLVQYSFALRDSVAVFKLPEAERAVSCAA
jgi:methyl-accepting chemotaxis protein